MCNVHRCKENMSNVWCFCMHFLISFRGALERCHVKDWAMRKCTAQSYWVTKTHTRWRLEIIMAHGMNIYVHMTRRHYKCNNFLHTTFSNSSTVFFLSFISLHFNYTVCERIGNAHHAHISAGFLITDARDAPRRTDCSLINCSR